MRWSYMWENISVLEKRALEKIMNSGSIFAIPQLMLDHPTNMPFRHPHPTY